MDKWDVEQLILDYLQDAKDEDAPDGLRDVQTTATGLLLTMKDGSQFSVTVKREKWAMSGAAGGPTTR